VPTDTAFHFVWDTRIWKDSMAVLERRQSDVMNFRSLNTKACYVLTTAFYGNSYLLGYDVV